jgi:cytochrome c oxidase assembly factor CtaG/polyferredoxin
MSPVARAVLTSWSIPFWPTLALLFTALLYVRGWRRLRQLRSTLLPKWRLACFLAGVASLWLAIASPLDTFTNFLLTVHMIQHLLLMLAAAPLILLASPQTPLLRGLPRRAVRDALGPFFQWPLLKRLGRAVTHPAFCWLTATVALLAWHVPAAYDLALASLSWHRIEHLCFFGTSLLFWWPVIQPWPSASHWPRWSMPAYLLSSGIVGSILAAFLCFSDRPLYSAYAAVPRLSGLSVLEDQVTAGALMWVFGSFVLLGALVVVTVRLLDPAGDVGKIIQKPPDWTRPTPASVSFDLLRMPLAGSLLCARYGRRLLQAIVFFLAAAVIVDGFFGHQMAPMNLAGVLPWTYGRALVVLALLAAGNLFCMACPFTLPRELGRRLGFATRHWPRALRSKWLSVGLLVLFFCANEVFDLWDSPLFTAWILVGYFATAFAVDTLFRGASFCKYVCPIGQWNFLGSLVSPLEVKIRRHELCSTCNTHDCLRGNEHHRGCELDLFLPRKVGNMDCTFCLDCVKACPHDNIGIVALNPVRDLVRDPVRSSLGRFSQRVDIAALALVLVFSAFVNAAGMVAPVTAWRDHWVERLSLSSAAPVTTLLFLIGLVLATTLFGAAVRAGRRLGRIARATRELFCSFALALVPAGLAMWGAHLLFHLSTSWGTAWPVVQRAAWDLGVPWLGVPHWSTPNSMLTASTLLDVQMVFLDAGLLLSLYVGWRVAHAYTRKVGDVLRLLVPWALLVVGLYASGIWVLLQPMQMRGMMHG